MAHLTPTYLYDQGEIIRYLWAANLLHSMDPGAEVTKNQTHIRLMRKALGAANVPLLIAASRVVAAILNVIPGHYMKPKAPYPAYNPRLSFSPRPAMLNRNLRNMLLRPTH